MIALTDFDKELLEMTSISEPALQIIKNSFGLPILQYYGYNEEELDYLPADGVCVDFGKMQHTGSELHAFIKDLNTEFKKNGLPYLAFGSEYFIELEDGNDCIAVIPAQDSMEAIRVAGTAGFNAGIGNREIREKLTEWKTEFHCDFTVIYADMQQIDAEFTKKPESLRDFAEALHDFSPDLVDRIEDGVDGLIRIMNSENMFTLYWD